MFVSHFPFRRLVYISAYFRVGKIVLFSYFFAEWYTSKGGICFALEMHKFYVIYEVCELYLSKAVFNR